MPVNNNILYEKLPTKKHFGEKPKTDFINNLDAVEVKLISYPTLEVLMNYLPNFVRATWSLNADDDWYLSDLDKLKIVQDVFYGKTLPTAKETINFVFLIKGIDLTEVTHIIRYRNGSYSADCSAEKLWHQKDCVVPFSIQNSFKFYQKYKSIVNDAKQLYTDMCNSGCIPIADARSILPRSLSTFYYLRFNLNDVLHFINQRKDRQIQPEVDNIIAYKMWYEILKVYPMINDLVDLDSVDMFYVTMGDEQGRMYLPEEKNDIFEYNEESFLYKRKRSEMNGTNDNDEYYFDKVKKKIWLDIEAEKLFNEQTLERRYNTSTSALKKHNPPRSSTI